MKLWTTTVRRVSRGGLPGREMHFKVTSVCYHVGVEDMMRKKSNECNCYNFS